MPLVSVQVEFETKFLNENNNRQITGSPTQWVAQEPNYVAYQVLSSM